MTVQRGRGMRRPGGFSLIEVMIGMMLLAIGLLAISAMVPTAYTNVSASGTDTRALAFAQQRLDQLRALPYGNAALSGGTHTDPVPATGYTQSYLVEVDTPMAGVKRVTVTVTGPRSRQMQLVTLITS